MKFRDWATVLGLGSAATLIYGCVVESDDLTLERHTLDLAYWPSSLSGFRIAVVGDLHLRGEYSAPLARQAIAMAMEERPDMVALVGDYVGYWSSEIAELLTDVLRPLRAMKGAAVAVPGNHDYQCGSADLLVPICGSAGVRLLRNESWSSAGVNWVGVDSFNAGMADPIAAMGGFVEEAGGPGASTAGQWRHASAGDSGASTARQRRHAAGGSSVPLRDPGRRPNEKSADEPRIALWHEPDVVGLLPTGCALMLAGHSHGGQFTFWGGFTPMKSINGSRYLRGFYPNAPTPLYVTRGVGTTGPPSRLNCSPEVSLLTLESAR